MLSAGSSEAQNPKYNQFKLINVPNLYEQENNLKFDNIQYVLKLHSWNKNLNPLTAKLNQAGPQKQKKKSKKPPKSKKKTEKNMKKSKSGKNLVLAVPGSFSPKKGKNKRHSLSVLGIKHSGKTKKNKKKHFSTKSSGLLGGDLGQLMDDEEEEKRSGSRKKNKKNKQMRRAKSMVVMPKMQEMPISKINNDVNFDRYSFGKCLISSYELPKWGWLCKKKRESGHGLRYGYYHLFLRFGGIKAEFDDHSNEIDLVLFNSVNCNYNGLNKDGNIIIDAYYQKLPSFRKTIESPNIVFNDHGRKSMLYSFGGYCDGKALSTISECQLNVNKISGLKWKRNRNKQEMLIGRYGCEICWIGNNRYIILGGTNKKSKAEKSCEIYNNFDKCEDEYCTSISSMCYKRSKLSSTLISEKNQIIVGGGMIYGKGSTQIEIYDIYSDQWILHKSQFNFEHKYPLIWMDFYNVNICYIAGDWIGFGGRKDSLGFIEWIDLRERGKKKWNMFDDNTFTDLFKIQGVRPNLWESRSLTML